MAESTLSRGFDEIVVEVADYLGLGRTYSNLSTDDQNRVDEYVQAGVRQFYFPPPLPGPDGQSLPPHKWSFLQTTTTITCVVGTEAYDLADNYGGGIEYLTYADGQNKARINVIGLREFLTIGANTTGNGVPKYAAVRPKTTTGSTGQRFEVLLNPKPDNTYVLTYEFEILPDEITTSLDYPYGGMAHAETVMASCLAMAEERDNDGVRGPLYEKFIERLRASVAYDQLEWSRRRAKPHPQTTPTTLATTYTDLQREVGRFMGYAPDPIAWSYDETEEVDGLIHDGLRRFYYPPIVDEEQEEDAPKERQRHTWSFLHEAATVSAILDDPVYDLPSDFGGVLSDMWYSAGAGQRPIRIIDEAKLGTLRGMDDTNGKPRYCAIRPKSFDATSGQIWELLLYPKPDASYTLAYHYNVVPARLTTTNLYPRGGHVHGETILASCLAEAELRKTGERGPREQHFLSLLKTSIELDQKSAAVTTDTAIVAETASTQSAVFTDLVRDVGAYLGFGRDSQLFSQSEFNLCDDIVQRGLRQFYNPPLLPGQLVAHCWRFLHPVTTLSTVASDYDYDLPSGFSSIHSTFTYDPTEGFAEIVQIPEQKIRAMRAAGTNTGKPVFCAIRTKSYDGSVDPLFEVIFYPTPDAAYTLSYSYNLIAPRIDATNKFPIGGNIHAGTIRKSVMAAAEAERGLGERTWEDRFMKALAASISRDNQTAPEYFGYNGDHSSLAVYSGRGAVV